MKVITTHKGTDYDGLASLIAGTLIYPDAVPVLPSFVNINLKPFLAIHKDLFNLSTPDEINLYDITTLIVVDTHSWNRLDRRFVELPKKSELKIIVWDHHIEGDMKIDEAHIKETGATVTMMIQEIELLGKFVTPIQATLFLMGLYEDTGNLSFPSTLAEDAFAAGFLLDKKADLTILSTFLKNAYGRQQKDILYQLIEGAERIELNGFTISFCQLDIKGRIQNLAMVIQMYREIINVNAAFGIFRDEENDKCMIIGRSGVEAINIGLIMRSMGGGGHPGAGSALLKGAKPQAIREMIKELISGNQYSSVLLSDLMSYPVDVVKENASIEKVFKIIKEKGYTGMPVVDDDQNIVGVISRRDFKKLKKAKDKNSPIKAFMSRNIITTEPDKSAMEAAKLMIKHDIGRIPIITDNKIIGIVTRSDLMTYFYDILPLN